MAKISADSPVNLQHTAAAQLQSGLKQQDNTPIKQQTTVSLLQQGLSALKDILGLLKQGEAKSTVAEFEKRRKRKKGAQFIKKKKHNKDGKPFGFEFVKEDKDNSADEEALEFEAAIKAQREQQQAGEQIQPLNDSKEGVADWLYKKADTWLTSLFSKTTKTDKSD